MTVRIHPPRPPTPPPERRPEAEPRDQQRPSPLRRALAPTALTTIGGSALAIAINIATDTPAEPWPWAVVGALTASMFVFTLWHQHRSNLAQAVPEQHSGQDPEPENPQQHTASGPQPGTTTTIGHSLVIGPVYQVSGAARVITGVPGARMPNNWVLRVVAALTATSLLVALVVVGAKLAHSVETAPPAGPGATAAATAAEDVTMHEVWPSSRANRRLSVPPNDWVATDFAVTQPYLRSIEVGAMHDGGGPNRAVLLRVLDQDGRELAAGEATISDYRAKYVFSHPVDVRAHLGKHLYLELLNITDRPVTAYMSTDDADSSVNSYLSCGSIAPARCPNPESRDLSALVVGRNSSSPW